MNSVQSIRKRFFHNEDGTIAIIVAILLPALIGFGVLAVDVGHYYSTRSGLQQATDISGLSVLVKMRDEDRVDVLNVGTAAARYHDDVVTVAEKNQPAAATGNVIDIGDVQFGNWDFTRKVFSVNGFIFPTNAVRINASLSAARANPVKALFGKLFKDHMDMSVSTVAVMPVPPAFHMLSADARGALEMHGDADIDVYTVQVNSSATNAFVLQADPQGIGAGYIGVNGGVSGGSHGAIVTGASALKDFLEELPEPTVLGCSETNYVTTDRIAVLEPGVYCGGLTITGADDVTLNPGLYVIKDGPLTIDATMAHKPIKGDDVLIYLVNEQAELKIEAGDFSIRAQRTGPWAGVALMATRGTDAPARHAINGNTTYVSGIFYTPNSKVELEGGKLNGVCRYLCFVSDTLKITNTLVNYSPALTRWTNPFGDTTLMPAEPPALQKTFRPYLLNELPAGPL